MPVFPSSIHFRDDAISTQHFKRWSTQRLPVHREVARCRRHWGTLQLGGGRPEDCIVVLWRRVLISPVRVDKVCCHGRLKCEREKGGRGSPPLPVCNKMPSSTCRSPSLQLSDNTTRHALLTCGKSIRLGIFLIQISRSQGIKLKGGAAGIRRQYISLVLTEFWAVINSKAARHHPPLYLGLIAPIKSCCFQFFMRLDSLTGNSDTLACTGHALMPCRQ